MFQLKNSNAVSRLSKEGKFTPIDPRRVTKLQNGTCKSSIRIPWTKPRWALGKVFYFLWHVFRPVKMPVYGKDLFVNKTHVISGYEKCIDFPRKGKLFRVGFMKGMNDQSKRNVLRK